MLCLSNHSQLGPGPFTSSLFYTISYQSTLCLNKFLRSFIAFVFYRGHIQNHRISFFIRKLVGVSRIFCLLFQINGWTGAWSQRFIQGFYAVNCSSKTKKINNYYILTLSKRWKCTTNSISCRVDIKLY